MGKCVIRSGILLLKLYITLCVCLSLPFSLSLLENGSARNVNIDFK